jgi:hypothetical protein
MSGAKPYAGRLTSRPCSICPDLRRLVARITAALRNARNLHSAVEKALDSAALHNLEEELKQTSAARTLTLCAIQAHLTSHHSQTRGVRLAA